MNILAIYSDFTLIEINRQPLGREYIIIYCTAVVFCTVTQGGTDTRQQLRCAEGLGNIIICAQIQGFYLIGFLPASRNDDNRNGRPFSDFFQNFNPIHIRQTQIQKNQIGAMGGYHGKCLSCCFCKQRRIGICLQRGCNEVADGILIFDNHDFNFIGHNQILLSLAEQR